MQVGSLNIEQLRSRFFLEESPWWWLTNVTRPKELIGKFRDDDPVLSHEEKLLYSWMQLEELMATIPYGYARVVLKKNQNDNIANSPTLYVTWGRDQKTAGIGSSSSLLTASGTNNNNEAMFERLLEMQQRAHEREMDTMKMLMETKFQKDVLEAEIEGLGQPSVSEELLRGGLDILKSVVSAPRVPASLGTLGTQPGTPIKEGQPPQSGERNFSVDQALQDIGVIRQSLPHYHVNDVLRTLALFTSQQPEQAASYIGMLMQSVK